MKHLAESKQEMMGLPDVLQHCKNFPLTWIFSLIKFSWKKQYNNTFSYKQYFQILPDKLFL